MVEITAETVFPALVQRLNLDLTHQKIIIEQAKTERCSPFDYLVASGLVSQTEIYRQLASLLGLNFIEPHHRVKIVDNTARALKDLAMIKAIRIGTVDPRPLVLAPDFRGICSLIRALEETPDLARTTLIMSPKLMLKLLVLHHGEQLSQYACWNLAEKTPAASAYVAMGHRTKMAGFAAALLIAFAVVISPLTNSYFALFVCFNLFFLPSLFRILAIIMTLFFNSKKNLPDIQPYLDVAASDLPTYSVLIPLRNEVGLVDQLVVAMDRIDYPKSKIDVLFVVEDSSADTLASLEIACESKPYKIIAVPPSEPATKPKALDFAISFARGEHIVVFDAEDIPHPQQLRWAAAHFMARPGTDCFQADLVIDNGATSFLSAMFAGEYAGLFGVYLPMLARLDLPLPLGGTSNHFRRRALLEVGVWDAHNVTEDADLGMRLSRMRYKCETLTPSPASRTHEDAPTQLRVWLHQRTRWLKGWMVTLIVHNQNPLELLADLGLRRFIFFQLLIGSMVLSMPLHMFSAIFIATKWIFVPDYFSQLNLISLVNMFFLLVGHASIVLMNILGLIRLRHYPLIPFQLLQPLYWLVVSFAAVRAAIQLRTSPFKWEKTPHQTAQKSAI